jgi:hypothetical protein
MAMKVRTKSLAALGFAIALGSPLASHAFVWETTNDEAGSRIVTPAFGAASKSVRIPDTKALRLGEISSDGQYVYLGEASGWQLRPMEYRIDRGRLTHVDDPVGHMERKADATPILAGQSGAHVDSSGS